jgi:hypothetical protein
MPSFLAILYKGIYHIYGMELADDVGLAWDVDVSNHKVSLKMILCECWVDCIFKVSKSLSSVKLLSNIRTMPFINASWTVNYHFVQRINHKTVEEFFLWCQFLSMSGNWQKGSMILKNLYPSFHYLILAA